MKSEISLTKSNNHYGEILQALVPFKGSLKAALSEISLLVIKINLVITRTPAYNQGLELPFSQTMLQAPFLVSITRSKTHCSVVMTAGIKNVLVGAIHKYSMRKKIHRSKSIHRIIASISDLVYPHFVVIDGTVGMEDGGPIRGKTVKSGWSLSSFDALAADSLTAI